MGVSKINWIKIKNDYINGRGSYRKLADKYGISATSIGKRARLEGWAEQREKQLHKSYTKVAQKTADRIAEREADRVARLLGTTDKLQDA
ncbi:MAG: helix-turn-helix domain-containing protein, partial [Clostridiales bacterium]|nr:helix-turn-helix domain-containing protein [Clostridiales bacterium]